MNDTALDKSKAHRKKKVEMSFSPMASETPIKFDLQTPTSHTPPVILLLEFTTGNLGYIKYKTSQIFIADLLADHIINAHANIESERNPLLKIRFENLTPSKAVNVSSTFCMENGCTPTTVHNINGGEHFISYNSMDPTSKRLRRVNNPRLEISLTKFDKPITVEIRSTKPIESSPQFTALLGIGIINIPGAAYFWDLKFTVIENTKKKIKISIENEQYKKRIPVRLAIAMEYGTSLNMSLNVSTKANWSITQNDNEILSHGYAPADETVLINF